MPRCLAALGIATFAALAGAGVASASALDQRNVLHVDPGTRTCSDTRAVSAVSVAAPWCTIDRALEGAPGGSVVTIAGGTYDSAAIDRVDRDRRVTFKPVRGANVTLKGLTVERSSGVRFQGFRFTGRVWVLTASNVQIVGNAFSPQGIVARSADSVVIARNRFRNLTYDGSPVGAGYAISLLGGARGPGASPLNSDITIRGNRFTHIPADAIQAGTVTNLLIERNEFDHVEPFLRATEHSDAIQLLGTSKKVRIKGNYFHDMPRALIAKRAAFHGLVIENNLMVRLSGLAVNIYDAPAVRVVNNTIWKSGLLGLRFRDLPQVPEKMERAVVANNIIDSVGFARSQMAFEDYNLIGKRKAGVRFGRHDAFGKPRFARRGNFQLSRASRAVDSASAKYAPRRDRVGRSRIDVPSRRNKGAGDPRFADRGAHEFRPRKRSGRKSR
jgi:hypothetical protein